MENGLRERDGWGWGLGSGNGIPSFIRQSEKGEGGLGNGTRKGEWGEGLEGFGRKINTSFRGQPGRTVLQWAAGNGLRAIATVKTQHTTIKPLIENKAIKMVKKEELLSAVK